MPEYRKGIENVPLLSPNTDCPIMVFVIDLKNDSEVVEQKELNLANHEHRKYLGKLTFWAVNNNHSIETMSVKDANGG
jgi:hypothetical protein